MNTKPLISVIIPVFKRPDFLHQAIASVKAQTWPNIEIVVVDDGSGDDIVSQYVIPDGVIFLRHPQTRGPGAARNTGFAASHGDFIAWLDSDDAWLPGKLKAQVELLQNHPEAGMAYCHATRVDENLKPRTEQIVPHPVTCNPLHRVPFHNPVQAPSCVLARREAVERTGGFDESLKGSEDWDLWINMSRWATFAYDPYPWTLYRTHETQRSNFGLHRLLIWESIRAKWLAWAERESPQNVPLLRRVVCRGYLGDASLNLRYGGGLRKSLYMVMNAIHIAPSEPRNYVRVLRLLAVAATLAVARRR